MAQSGAILSGSAALVLLHPGSFSPRDLDFYVLPRGYSLFLSFVLDQGYVVEPDRDLSLAYERDALLVLKLVHTDSGKELNVVTVLAGHVVHGITGFHSTLVMNYVAWYGVVSLYPRWTSAKKGLIIRETATTTECFEKYRARGFMCAKSNDILCNSNLGVPEHLCQISLGCAKTTRYLLDGNCDFQPFWGLSENLAHFEQRDMSWVLPIPCVYTE